MPDTHSAAGLETAKILLDIKAVNFRPAEPYTLTAGWASPVYIDCRKLISFTDERRRVIELGVQGLRDAGALDGVDYLAGGETAGIPYAAWMAEATGIPMLYIRKKPKGFGRGARIEGHMEEGKKAILIEDLATDGGSKVNFVNALRDAGAACTDTWVVFFYGAFPNAGKELADLGVGLHYLAMWTDVLKVAEDGNYFPDEDIQGVKDFLADPAGWSAAHGGKGAE